MNVHGMITLINSPWHMEGGHHRNLDAVDVTDKQKRKKKISEK